MSRANKNALTEFNIAVRYTQFIKCATIVYTPSTLWEMEEEKPMPSKTINLNLYHSVEDYHRFLDELDFNYDAGYGGQELDGTIWLEDGRWLTRGEYDGSEWWVLHTVPPIPEHLGGQPEPEYNGDESDKSAE